MNFAKNVARRSSVVRSFVALVTSFTIAACSSSNNYGSVPAQQSQFQARPAAMPHAHGKSWMNRSAKPLKLLYVSDFGSAQVDVYTYPYLRQAGVLTGFNELRGECTDPSGYVWIVDQAMGEVLEFAHGGTTPVNVLSAPDPWGCATSPKNGDIAVSYASAGQIEIFHNAAGSGTVVSDSNFAGTLFLGYDKTGNLFVDGYDASGNFHYAELPAGSSTFTDITLSQTPLGVGNVQWDGTYMAVGDSGSTIYQTQGSNVVSSTTLGNRCIEQFYILPTNRKVIAPDACDGSAGIFHYPAGGAPLQTISGGLLIPYGVVLSK
jgi:hypothetical protein